MDQLNLLDEDGDFAATDLAWAAGIVDGEGCITIARGTKAWRKTDWYLLVVHVMMTDRNTLEHLHAIFKDGQIYSRPPRKAHHSTPWLWKIAGQGAFRAIKLIRPYLITKAAQADLAIEFQGLGKTTFNRGGVPPALDRQRKAMFDKMKELKHPSH